MDDINIKCDMNFDGMGDIKIANDIVPSEPKKKKKKSEVKEVNGVVMIDDTMPTPLTNIPYMVSYDETNNMLRSSIYMTDKLAVDIDKDLTDIRAAKTLKNKYSYISDLTSAMSSIVGSRISAIREMNASITHAHELELKRMKDLKTSEPDTSDDKKIADLYNAYISTPLGIRSSSFIPNPVDLAIPNQKGIEMVGASSFDSYMQNMTPQQNMMRLENDPNIKTVVKYDSSTGNRWFDVINISTGESIPNADKPDVMFLDNITIDTRNGLARDTKLEISYPLIVFGSSKLEEY